MVQRPTASAELLDTLHLLCHFKGKIQYHRSYSSVRIVGVMEDVVLLNTVPLFACSHGDSRKSQKLFLGLDCFSTPANQSYSFFTLCHGCKDSQGVSCSANCKTTYKLELAKPCLLILILLFIQFMTSSDWFLSICRFIFSGFNKIE